MQQIGRGGMPIKMANDYSFLIRNKLKLHILTLIGDILFDKKNHSRLCNIEFERPPDL